MRSLILPLAALLIAAPASAQVSSIQSANSGMPKLNKDGKVCEIIEETGTRLGKKRVCMTPQEWLEQRRDHRNDVERAQKNIGIRSEG